jgi:glycosyltransferase involved in cell wall biosynthesis
MLRLARWSKHNQRQQFNFYRSNNMSKNKISICMATYNGEKYLKDQLDSLVKQSVKPYEVILQDDCSIDKTVEIAKTYKNILNLNIIVNEVNLGFKKNFELVLSKATGDLIAPCDQDDIWLENKLEILMSQIGDYSLVYSNSLLVDSDGNSLNKRISDRLKNNFTDTDTPINFIYGNSVSAHSMLFKKELLKYIFPFPNLMYFDAWIAAVASSFEGVKYIDIDLVKYRQHSTNSLANKKFIKYSISEQIFQKTKKKLIQNKNTMDIIDELLAIKKLKDKDFYRLLELRSYLESFENNWFNFSLFIFYLKNRNDFYLITKKNRFITTIKKSIGYKLYKLAPFL